MTIPNLAGIATANLVEKIGTGSFTASYINWSRTMNLLREHAPGWLPELVSGPDGIVHSAPVGAYLLIRFKHVDGTVTPEVPQAIMDTRNAAIPREKVTARDITDTHRRGVCMAAAFTFGLAYELWAKIALESGYEAPASGPLTVKVNGTDGVWDGLDRDTQLGLERLAIEVKDFLDAGDAAGAVARIERDKLGADEKTGLWTLLDSKARSALKKAAANATNYQSEKAA